MAVLLTLGVLIAPLGTARAACDPSRRLLLGGLKCDAPAAGTWYQIEVYYGCTPHPKGGFESVLELKEKQPNLYETRATMKRSEVERFISKGVLKGNRNPPLFTSVMPGGRGEVQELCGEETRTTVFKRTCGEGKNAVSVGVDVMCKKEMNVPVPHLILNDLGNTPDAKPKQLRSMGVHDMLSKAHGAKGKPRGTLWKGKAGKGGQVELEGLFKPDGGFFEYVDLELTPKEGETCSDLIHVFALWSLKWPPKPRFGFVEAAAVKPLGTNVFTQLHLSISPLQGEPCEKLLDVTEAWERTWQ